MVTNVLLKSQTSSVTGPAVQSKQLPAALVLLAEVLWDTTADLRKSAAHDFAKVSLAVMN